MPKLTLITEKKKKISKKSPLDMHSASWDAIESSFHSQYPIRKHRKVKRCNRGKLSLCGNVSEELPDECADINISQESINESRDNENNVCLIETDVTPTHSPSCARSPVFSTSQVCDAQGKGSLKRRFLAELSPTFSRTKTASDESPAISSFGSQTPTPSRMVCVTGLARPPSSSGREEKPRKRRVKDGESERLMQMVKRWQSEIAVWRHSLRTKETDKDGVSLMVLECHTIFSQLQLTCRVMADYSCLLPGEPSCVRLLLLKSFHKCDETTFPAGTTLVIYHPWETHRSDDFITLWNVWHWAMECW